MIMKRCRKCGYTAGDENERYCPKCSNRAGNGKVELDITEDDPIASPSLKGDGNVIGESLNDNRVYNDHRTIITKELSDEEKLRQKEKEFRKRCAEYIRNGIVSPETERLLEAYRRELDLDKDIADRIAEEVRKSSVVRSQELSNGAKIELKTAEKAIEGNDTEALREALKKLRPYLDTEANDDIQQLYYQLKAILRPEEFLLDYRQFHAEGYWETFWSYVVLKQKDPDKAEASVAALSNFGTEYPAGNQALLKATGFLMDNKVNDARVAFSLTGNDYSEGLRLLHLTLKELLETEWREEGDDVAAKTKFYAENLFEKAYDRKRAGTLEKIAERKREEARVKSQKEEFILKYREKEGNVDEALSAMSLGGMSLLTYKEWRREDSDFSSELDRIDAEVNTRREEMARREAEEKQAAEAAAAEAKRREEKERELREKKDNFRRHYALYKADFDYTCDKTGFSPSEVKEWRSADSSFDRELSAIEGKEKKRIRTAKFKKALPYILGILLIIIIVAGIILTREQEKQQRLEEERREMLWQQKLEAYNSDVELADRKLDLIPQQENLVDFNRDFTLLEESRQLMDKMAETERSSGFEDKKESLRLRGKLLEKIEILHKYSADVASDPRAPEFHAKGEEYLRKIDEFKKEIK